MQKIRTFFFSSKNLQCICVINVLNLNEILTNDVNVISFDQPAPDCYYDVKCSKRSNFIYNGRLPETWLWGGYQYMNLLGFMCQPDDLLKDVYQTAKVRVIMHLMA